MGSLHPAIFGLALDPLQAVTFASVAKSREAHGGDGGAGPSCEKFCAAAKFFSVEHAVSAEHAEKNEVKK